ncbi:putative WD-repeat protein [Quillaja saponaria]|uniref:WD-repeat protein n=1 Tax=Quillaja saponaria TaxID=32244 RepID=A0AAD7L6R0_QUISA|nr:putative WD-repeat protein [Quillaja saponaria]
MEMFSERDADQFFDTRDEISSVSDGGSDVFEECTSSTGHVNIDSHCLKHEVWTKNLQSVKERRRNFLRLMRLDSDGNFIAGEELGSLSRIKMEVDRVTENSGAVLRTSDFDEELSSTQSMMDSMPNEASDHLEYGALVDNCVCRFKNLDDGTEYVVDELGEDGMPSKLRVLGSNQLVSMDEFQRNLGPSSLVHRVFQRNSNSVRYLGTAKKKLKRGWLRKLGSVACIVHDNGGAKLNHKYLDSTLRTRMQIVRVHPYKKRCKELSSLYLGQEFLAHEGSILAMKFSLDGRYVATGGEDGVVRVWKMIEDKRSSELDITDLDPSCIYYTMTDFSPLVPLDIDKEKLDKMVKLRITSNSACVILPPKIFRILESPLHEFHGHSGEVLDFSWSKKGFLLSSSIDKTVRLWQVGTDRCLRVFSHNNYVTSVNFNPVDDNFFISGSIDGKVRIWEVLGCQVVDYIDTREIVTAVCYHPDGKGGIVGTMSGNCRFYDIIDNHLELDAQVCLQGKKKTPRKRITGFQFSPSDPSKVMVTSADSLVRVISGVDVICQFRGPRNAESQMLASFTSDGKHIVSVGEDSNVCIWNYTSQDKTSSKPKNIRSLECFSSHNASIAIPWCGIEPMPGTPLSPAVSGDMWGSSLRNGNKYHNVEEDLNQKLSISSPDCFSLSRGFLLESLPKGSATWPEEKLADSSPTIVSPTMCKSEYKFLKSACQGISSSPHLWGALIVTAGWDGRIRVYHNYGLPVRL